MEKRREIRVTPDLLEPVEVQIMGKDFLDVLTARDVGKNGIGVNIPEGYASTNVMDEVLLIISIPGHRSFDAIGSIKHTDGEKPCKNDLGLGILFTKIRAADRQTLEKYIDARLSESRQNVRVTPTSEHPVEAQFTLGSNRGVLDVHDISLGGLGVARPPLIEKTTLEIDILVVLPGWGQIIVKGSLRFPENDSEHMGICFSHLTSDQESTLRNYISKRVVDLRKTLDRIE